MKYILTITIAILFFNCKPKLKIYDTYALMKDIHKRDDNFYVKDISKNYRHLKGNWQWTNELDTLIIEIKPIFKKKLGENYYPPKKNAFYDTNQINVKFIKNGEVIVDQINIEHENCLYVDHLGVNTNMFYVYERCTGPNYVKPILMFVGNDLLLINRWNEKEGVFIKKEGAYEVKIPRTITLKRML